MDSTIITVIISGVITIMTTLITSKNTEVKMEVQIDVIKEELTKLTAKVEQHNNYGLEIADLQARVKILEGK